MLLPPCCWYVRVQGPLNPTHARNGTDDGPGGDGDDDEDDDAQPELTRGQLLRIASGMLGLMFGWATKVLSFSINSTPSHVR